MEMKKILIADDDKNLLEIYAEIFQKENFQVFKAHDGQEAWGLIGEGNFPDIILTGIMMPRMTGFELIAKIKADPKLAKIPIAVSSHRGLAADEKKAKDLGADDFIIQGVSSPVDVVKRIKILLGIEAKFLITFLADSYDGRALINFLSRLQGIKCEILKEADLEINFDEKSKIFSIKLSC